MLGMEGEYWVRRSRGWWHGRDGHATGRDGFGQIILMEWFAMIGTGFAEGILTVLCPRPNGPLYLSRAQRAGLVAAWIGGLKGRATNAANF